MKTVIISPSGKFYGSEQTLHCFLKNSTQNYRVFINKTDGQLLKKTNELKKHKVSSFGVVKSLYVRIFLGLLLNRYKKVYCNEGGHINYIKLIAKVFPNVEFHVHIRLTEDTSAKRLSGLPENVHLICVSAFIQSLVYNNTNLQTEVLSSPNRGVTKTDDWRTESNTIKNIGIIGRVTPSKGINHIINFIEYLEEQKCNTIQLHFYGDIEHEHREVASLLSKENKCEHVLVKFHGYLKREAIYNDIDMVVHFNEDEPLGVIFFEALNAAKPFIGFNSGGIGNIASNIGISDLMIDRNSLWMEDLKNKISSINQVIDRYKDAQSSMLQM